MLYEAHDVCKKLGITMAALAIWRREGLKHTEIKKSKYYSGDNIIDFLMEKKAGSYGDKIHLFQRAPKEKKLDFLKRMINIKSIHVVDEEEIEQSLGAMGKLLEIMAENEGIPQTDREVFRKYANIYKNVLDTL